eukprot:4150218-Ditylum_brightwellii.AAC.1
MDVTLEGTQNRQSTDKWQDSELMGACMMRCLLYFALERKCCSEIAGSMPGVELNELEVISAMDFGFDHQIEVPLWMTMAGLVRAEILSV